MGCMSSRLSTLLTLRTTGILPQKEGGKQVIAVIFEAAYHVSAVGIVVILTIFTLCQYIENIHLANEGDVDDE